MKTIKDYSEAIRNKYIRDKKIGILRGEIYKLTPASIRKLCQNLLMEELSQNDKNIITNFFGIKTFEESVNAIKKYDIDGFRPICKFLKKENETISCHNDIELIAILIGYKARPFNTYRITNTTEENNDANLINEDLPKNEKITETDNSNTKIKLKDRNYFSWQSSSTVQNTFKITVVVLICLILALLILRKQTKWMVWKGNQYIEVAFDPEKYKINQLKLYKEERITNFKKIIPDCNTKFFNEDGSENLWYGKNTNGELEYFTDLGLHPETGETLKKITRYMIKKHICDL